MPRGISKKILKNYEPKRRNPITLGDDSNIDNNLKVFKIDGENTILELSKDELKVRGAIDASTITVDGASVQIGTDAGATELNELSDVTYSSGDLTITSLDTIVASGLTLDIGGDIIFDANSGVTKFYLAGDTDDLCTLTVASNGATTIATADSDGTAGDLTLDVDGVIKLDAASILTDAGIKFLMNGTEVGNITGHHSATYFTLYENVGASTNDYFSIKCAANGASTIETIDGAGADGNLTLDADGDITLDSETGGFVASKAGTEFSATKSSYAGMILGYTRLEGDLTNQSSFEIQNSLTVEDSTHQISFKTPPSENVEIEATFVIDCRQTDTEINVGLSDNSTYNAVGENFEYDSVGISFTDDEIDDGVRTVKWVLSASHLASVGSDNTFYVGFSTSGVTKLAYLTYGVRASHGLGDHPFVIKATALPVTIYDGT